MAHLDLEPWEPEETVGKLWHAFASRLDAPLEHAAAAVELVEVEGRLGVFFRGLGGVRHAEIRASALEPGRYRRSWRRTLATDTDRLAKPSFDGETLRLPGRIAEFPDREANTALYFWLTAAAAHACAPASETDPLRQDVRALQ
ncbi:MAG: nitric oxide reductase D protein, partial [Pseudomonadota bacterium]